MALANWAHARVTVTGQWADVDGEIYTRSWMRKFTVDQQEN